MTTALATLSNKLAHRFGMGEEAVELVDVLKATAFKVQATDAQLTALLLVAQQYSLNPWTKEIYAFPDKGGIVPVVGVDGWARIINEHPAFDGMDFEQDADSCTCAIYRKDRTRPTKVTEYMSECKRGTQPWQSHPKRMLRHKAMIQCARLAFGFAGIFDADEAERIVENSAATAEPKPTPQRAANAAAPADMAQFEAEHLQGLRDAALLGLTPLNEAFAKLPKGPQKVALWQTHGEALKRAATNAAATDAVILAETPAEGA